MRAHTVGPLFTFHPDRIRSRFAGLAQLADPRRALASLVPFCAGAALAFDQRGAIDVRLAASAYLAIFLIEIGKNAVHDLYNPRTSRRELLDKHDLINIAWLSFALAAVVGTFVVAASIPALLLLGVGAAAVAAAYSLPPLSLARRGLGELAVSVIYGPGIVLGTMLMLRGVATIEAMIVSITLGMLMSNAVLVTEMRLCDRTAPVASLLYIIAFALPITWGVYAGPFRLIAVFAGIPAAILASSALNDRIQEAAEGCSIAAYALTGVALTSAIALM